MVTIVLICLIWRTRNKFGVTEKMEWRNASIQFDQVNEMTVIQIHINHLLIFLSLSFPYT